MPETPHRNALQPGHLLHWYRIERILGQGGFGITYLAHDTNLDREVAIKEYLPVELAVRDRDASVHPVSGAHGDDFRWGLDRFITEARTLARFDHPNVVRVLSVFEDNNTAYMVMRYERGRSLHEMLPRRGTLEEPQLMAILFPVLGGLRLVHAEGFIHRDIKPANIFIREDGSPLLLDFGSARQALGQETKTLTTLVSPGYAPFEQYYSKSDAQGPWTDVYGLGATMYRAVVGVAPMDAVDRSEGLLKRERDPYVPAVEAAAGRYSRRFLEAIDRALAFREDERPQDVDAWAAAFDVPDATTEIAPRPPPDDGHPRVTDAASAAPETGASEAETRVAGDTAPPTEPVPEAARASSTAGASEDRDALYRTFVGKRGADYYAPCFARFDASGRRIAPSWNPAAAFATFLWMLYRRMYLWAFVLHPLVTFALTFAAMIPISIVGFGGGKVPDAGGVPVLLAASVLWPGFLANAVYHRRAARAIARTATIEGDAEARRAALAARGGTSRRAVAIAIAAIVILLVLSAVNRANRQAGVSDPGAATPAPEMPAAASPGSTADSGAGVEPTPPPATAAEARPDTASRGTTSDSPASGEAEPPESTPPDSDRVREVREALAAARAAAERGEFGAAREQLERAAALAPGNERIREQLGQLELHDVVRQGKAAVERRDWQAAERYLDQALRLDPDNKELKRFKKRLEQARKRAK